MRPLPATIRNALLAAATVVLAACASGPEIRHDTNPSANFASYKTFGFFSPLATDRAGYETVFTGRLKDATRRAMESKGYVYSEANPDLLLNFFANIEDKQEIRTTPVSVGGYYGYRSGFYGGYTATQVDTINYKAGTLNIDLVDSRQKVLVWQATAEGRVSSEARKNPGPAIDKVVAEMMTPLPGPGRM
jgi:Domain of unknown function (DUF4136)